MAHGDCNRCGRSSLAAHQLHRCSDSACPLRADKRAAKRHVLFVVTGLAGVIAVIAGGVTLAMHYHRAPVAADDFQNMSASTDQPTHSADRYRPPEAQGNATPEGFVPNGAAPSGQTHGADGPGLSRLKGSSVANDTPDSRATLSGGASAPSTDQPNRSAYLVGGAMPRPSFDCAGARAPSLLLICGDPELATIDHNADILYTQTLARNRDKKSLQRQRLAWVQERARLPANRNMLIASYQRWMALLAPDS
jgi:hypothetical protein